MSSDFSSRRSASSSLGFALTSALVSAVVFSGTGCLKAHIFSTNDGGSGGAGGSLTGTGGGVGGDNAGVGGDEGVGGDTGGGEGGAGVGGAGGEGTGGTMGTGGVPDAGQLAPTPDMPGQLVITEIMADTNAVSDESGEWFEVYNPSMTDTYDVFGCLLSDMGNTNQITTHIPIGPGAYLTFARFGSASVGGFTPSFDYHTTLDVNGVLDMTKDVKFGNGGDLARIACGANIVIDVVIFMMPNWNLTAVPNGRSLSLDPSHLNATDNDLQENWCPSPASAYHTTGSSDFGTPGMPNPPCPRG